MARKLQVEHRLGAVAPHIEPAQVSRVRERPPAAEQHRLVGAAVLLQVDVAQHTRKRRDDQVQGGKVAQEHVGSAQEAGAAKS